MTRQNSRVMIHNRYDHLGWEALSLHVLITEDLWWPLPEDFIRTYEVEYNPLLHQDVDGMYRLGETVEALVVRNKTQVNTALLAHFPRLRVVGRLGVGLDNIDVDACKSRGVTVIAARGFNANAVAEYVFAAMFERARFLRESDKVTKQGNWDRRQATGYELSGKTLGLIGSGDIGQRVALRARAMAMRVLAYDPFLLESNMLVQDSMVELVGLEDVLQKSDYISIHVPLLPSTHHLIGHKELEMMKEDALIINTARGGIIDEAALREGLQAYPRRFAVLDVREQEPPQADDQLFGLQNVLLTPHIAGITHESSRGVAQFILQQVDNKLQSRRCQGVVG